ncbi:DUF58 domain-containing protein [Sulfurimonas sp.]
MLKTLFASNKKLALILIKTQKEMFSKLTGEHTSNSRGEGYDFMELREYESGDDIRHIDWIISSKVGKPYVKLFHTQRELNVVIAPLLSASLHFGTSLLKKDLLLQICALIAYGCVKQNDSFESYICSDEVFLATPRTKQIFDVRTLAQKIDAYDVLGKKLDYIQIIQALYSRLQHKSIVFFIGDFFDAQSLNIQALSIKHELVVIIVRDRFEENPVPLGEVNITDPASGMSADISLDAKALKRYKKNRVQNDAQLQKKTTNGRCAFY